MGSEMCIRDRVVIPSKRSRKIIIPHDAIIYRQRNNIERCFGRLKHFRRFATAMTNAPSTSQALSCLPQL